MIHLVLCFRFIDLFCFWWFKAQIACLSSNYVPGKLLLVLERIMNAQTTESEKTDNHVFSVYISIASVKENRARFSAQFLSRSASAEYNALPWNMHIALSSCNLAKLFNNFIAMEKWILSMRNTQLNQESCYKTT